jgi:histidyl-tRNA synthetase
MEIQRCKGARDLLPDDMERFRQVEDAFRSTCINWGYREVKTPTLEYIHLFTATGTLTPAMLGRVYSFLDWDGWGGERIVLRPDGTIPAARLYCENMAGQDIARLYYITNVFAFEETGTSDREKWQCGVELIGDASPASDAEVIALAIEASTALGLPKFEMKLSHAGILKALISELKLDAEARASLLDEILEGNWQALSRVKGKGKGTAGVVSALMDLKGRSSGFLSNLKALPAISRDLKLEIDRFIAITELLDTLGYKYEIDFTSIKGFEYYTGLCFKITSGGARVCSGGRYDNLIGLVGGLEKPACGFAFYVDQVAALVKPWTRQKAWKTVIVRTQGKTQAAIKAAFAVAASLRRAGLIAELDFCGSQMNARWTVNIQARPKSYVVRDSVRDAEKTVSDVKDIVNIIGGFGNGR